MQFLRGEWVGNCSFTRVFMKKLICLLLALLALAACSRISPIQEPVILVPAGISNERVLKVLAKVMVEREWTIVEMNKDSLVGKLDLRVHSVTVKAIFAEGGLKLTYVESEGLRYVEKDGVKYLHRKYLTWIKNLEKDLQKELSLALLEL